MPMRRIAPPVILAAVVLTGLAASAEPVKRAAPAEALVMSGAYELANEAGTRKCLLLLRPSAGAGGYALGFPMQCRVALPVLQKVQSWAVRTMATAPRARIMLTDGDGKTQIDFSEAGPSGAGQARDEAGNIYTIRPVQGSSMATRVDSLVGARPAPPVAFSPPPPDPGAMAKATGRYRLLRADEHTTGCEIILEGAAAAAIEGRASMAAGCADKGLTFFSPKGWSIADNTLWLIGSRGRIGFERNQKGGWDKRPGQGAPLSLRRHEP